MALQQNVVSQFAKLVKSEKKEDSAILNGTYEKIGNKDYVRIDGSEILTPVDVTVDAENGDRVQVLLQNHSATVTNNITSPSAKSKDLSTIRDTVDEYGNTIQQMDNSIKQQNNSIIQINNNINQQNNTINQHNTVINQQQDLIQSIGNTINQQGNTITSMNNNITEFGNQISSMNNTIVEQNDNITSMNNTVQSFNNRITQNSNDISQYGNTINQQGNTIQQINNTVVEQGNVIVAQGNVIEAQGNQLTLHGSNITVLNSAFVIQDGVLTGLSTAIINTLKSNVLDTGYAKIDFANIQMAAIQKLFTDSGIIKNLVVEEGAITGELVGVTIKGDLIEGNTIVADKLVIRGSDGLFYKLNAIGETVETEQTSSNSLNGNVITAKSITASKIQVTDLVAFGATIGGFDISNTSINSHLKNDVNSSENGVYLGSDGQMAIGDDLNHIKYYRDQNGRYIFDVRLDKLYLGSSEKTLDQEFSSMVELSANNLSGTFKRSGGSNLLRNSVGFSDTDFWLATGVITTKQDDDMSLSGSEFILSNDAVLEQVYSTQPGTEYSIAFKYKHIIVGSSGSVKVELIGNESNSKIILNTTESAEEWTEVYLSEPYIATSSSPKIKISVLGDDILEITDLIISQGSNIVWSGYIDELYGKEHKLDSNGLRLFSQSSNKSTNTTSTSYQLKDGSNVIAELTEDRVFTNIGQFNKGTQIGRLRTVLLDDNNIIEYI